MARSPDLPSPVRHRALLFVIAAVCAGNLAAQPDKFGQPTDRAAPGKADQAEGARILADFRRGEIAGDYWQSFELRVLPRRGAEHSVYGTMFGTRGPNGPLTRLELGNERWLIESGPHAAAWHLGADGEAGRLAATEAGRALAGTGVTVYNRGAKTTETMDFR